MSRGSVDQLLTRIPRFPNDIAVSREAAVEAQLRSSIKLLLRDGDFVSTHLLTSAAAEVLLQIGASEGVQTGLAKVRAFLRSELGGELAREAQQFMDAPYNFLKHSSGDRTKQLFIQPEYVEFSLYQATIDFRKLFGRGFAGAVAIQAWGVARFPDQTLRGDEVRGAAARAVGVAGHPFAAVQEQARMFFDTLGTQVPDRAAVNESGTACAAGVP